MFTEDIELKDGLDNVVDYVDYDDSPPWDTLADGYGPSLTLCNPDSDNELPENWTHSVNYMAVNAAGDSIWATPGFECQVSLFAGFSADKQTVILLHISIRPGFTIFMWQFCFHHLLTYQNNITLLPLTKF